MQVFGHYSFNFLFHAKKNFKKIIRVSIFAQTITWQFPKELFSGSSAVGEECLTGGVALSWTGVKALFLPPFVHVLIISPTTGL